MGRALEDWSCQRRAAQRAPLLTAEQEQVLLARAQRGDKSAVNEIVASHMRLVVQVAARHSRAGLSPHDLLAEGVVGLLEAIRRFDPSAGNRFASYAVFWVRAHVSRYQLANRRIVAAPSTRAGRKAQAQLRRMERLLTQRLGRAPSRAELADALQVEEHDIEAADAALSGSDVSLGGDGLEPAVDAEGPETLVASHELHHLRESSVQRALSLLSPRESSIVREQMADDGRSLSDMARELGISRQRTGQILAAACEKLRGPLERVA